MIVEKLIALRDHFMGEFDRLHDSSRKGDENLEMNVAKARALRSKVSLLDDLLLVEDFRYMQVPFDWRLIKGAEAASELAAGLMDVAFVIRKRKGTKEYQLAFMGEKKEGGILMSVSLTSVDVESKEMSYLGPLFFNFPNHYVGKTIVEHLTVNVSGSGKMWIDIEEVETIEEWKEQREMGVTPNVTNNNSSDGN